MVFNMVSSAIMDPKWREVGVVMTGIPGVRGVDHIGITVPDLVQAYEFFTEALGC